MALSLSNHSVLSPCISASSSSKPSSNTLEFKTLALHSLRHHQHYFRRVCISVPRFPSFDYSPVHTRRSFKSSFSVENSTADTNEEAEGDHIDEKTSDLPSLKTLTQFYKEAIVEGDEKTVADIEAVIYSLEKEKNELVEKMSSLSAEITSGKEKYIRLQADFDNFRKRSDKERLTIRSNAQGEVIESLLPMVDNFERAKQQIKPESEMEKKIDTSYQGIYKQFVEIMRSLHVATVETVGKPFDPSLHEAIAREESQEFGEGIIIQEFRRGFLLGERLLRPAMVKVSAGPGKKKAAAPLATEESSGQPVAAAEVAEDS